MALEFNTIGVQLKYAIGTGTTRPTSGYTVIPDIKEIPEIQMSPSQLEVTNLVDGSRRYIPGVKDPGSDMSVLANMTTSLKTAWTSLCTAASTAWTSGNYTWFEVAIPNFDSFYFAGLPVDMGMSQQSVDAVEEANLHIIPNQVAGWATKSGT